MLVIFIIVGPFLPFVIAHCHYRRIYCIQHIVLNSPFIVDGFGQSSAVLYAIASALKDLITAQKDDPFVGKKILLRQRSREVMLHLQLLLFTGRILSEKGKQSWVIVLKVS